MSAILLGSLVSPPREPASLFSFNLVVVFFHAREKISTQCLSPASALSMMRLPISSYNTELSIRFGGCDWLTLDSREELNWQLQPPLYALASATRHHAIDVQ